MLRVNTRWSRNNVRILTSFIFLKRNKIRKSYQNALCSFFFFFISSEHSYLFNVNVFSCHFKQESFGPISFTETTLLSNSYLNMFRNIGCILDLKAFRKLSNFNTTGLIGSDQLLERFLLHFRIPRSLKLTPCDFFLRNRVRLFRYYRGNPINSSNETAVNMVTSV